MKLDVEAATRAQTPPVFNLDPFTEENILEPRAFHEALREAGAVVWLEKYGTYASGRYEEVRTIMSDFERFTVTGGIGFSDIRKAGAWRPASPIAEIDPPEHTNVRRTLQKILSPVEIRRWRETFEAVAEQVVDEAVAKGEVNAITDIIDAFILNAFPDVLGVDMPKEYFLILGDLNFNQMGPRNAILAAAEERAAPIVPKYDEYMSRARALPGGFAEKIWRAEDDGGFAKGTAGPHVRSFLRAGVDTTIAALGHVIHRLATNPEAWAAVRKDPGLIKRALEESLRLDSSSQCHFRTTTGAMELSGYALAADTKIAVFLNAANTDPRRWPESYRFDLDREDAHKHISFGAGAHVCIGQMIARLETDCLIGALARKVERLELAGEPRHRVNNVLRTFDDLPVRLVTS